MTMAAKSSGVLQQESCFAKVGDVVTFMSYEPKSELTIGIVTKEYTNSVLIDCTRQAGSLESKEFGIKNGINSKKDCHAIISKKRLIAKIESTERLYRAYEQSIKSVKTKKPVASSDPENRREHYYDEDE